MESKFYKWSKDGNKMLINSGFKEFDKQTNCIFSGNVIANTMYGNYIRPITETECNGQKHEQGYLTNYDLKFFHISEKLKEFIIGLNKQVILYEIFICRNGQRDIIGWLIEDNGKIIYDLLNRNNRGNYEKRYLALDMVKKILEEKRV